MDYNKLNEELRLILSNEDERISTLSNASAILNKHLANINWVGFYLMKNGELILGPFQGKSACTRISLNRGVCGKCARDIETIVVEDVHKFPGHIACDCASKSEICVPIVIDSSLYGLLDIDAPVEGRFTEADRRGLEEAIKIISEKLK